MKILQQLYSWIRKWFWSKPTTPEKEKRAHIPIEEVQHAYTCFKFEGQWIYIRKSELPMWEAQTIGQKRDMKKRFALLVRKRKIIFKEVNGQMTCIQNKSYADRPRKNNG